MKTILFITPYTPDNQGVGVSYSSQLLRELAKTCIVDLVYFRYENNPSYEPVSANIRVVLETVLNLKFKFVGALSHPCFFPLFTSRHNNQICKILKLLVKENAYNYIYFDFSQTFSYAMYINHPNKILMSHDVIAQKYSRMKKYLRPWAMWTEERLLKNGKVFTFSGKDCELLKNYYGIDAISTTFFLNPNVIKAMPEKQSDYFVFFGAWNRVENSEALNWFMDNVYNHLSSEFKYKVIGGGKMPENLKEKIGKCPNIEYLGFVDDPYPIIANARAEIAPLHMGAGVKVKCVEALGCGTPIIGTEVAFEGIGDKYRHAMFEANTVDEFFDIISSFSYSLEEKIQLKDFFLENYNNKQILKYINS